jgi:hypothetical protein
MPGQAKYLLTITGMVIEIFRHTEPARASASRLSVISGLGGGSLDLVVLRGTWRDQQMHI